jgi:hypothetical protein
MMAKHDVSRSGNLTKAELAALMQELAGETPAHITLSASPSNGLLIMFGWLTDYVRPLVALR